MMLHIPEITYNNKTTRDIVKVLVITTTTAIAVVTFVALWHCSMIKKTPTGVANGIQAVGIFIVVVIVLNSEITNNSCWLPW